MAKKTTKKAATKAATKKAAPKKAASKKSAKRPAPSAKAASKKAAGKKPGPSGAPKASKPISKVARATLQRLEEKDPGLGRLLKKAHAYVVFPSVGKAALVVGGAYGRGAVFEKGRFVGHATVGQTTAGLQLGGETFSEVVMFENPEAFERFKRGNLRFAANASAVLVKAGAAATKDLEKGVKVLAYARGGMLIEAAVGGQKFTFKPGGRAGGQDGGSEGVKGSGGRSSKSEERGDQSSDEESDDADEDSDENADEDSEDESDEPGPAGKAAGRIAGKVVKKAVGLVAGGAAAEAAGKAAAKAVAKFADKAAADAAEKALSHMMGAAGAGGGRRKR